MRKISNHSCGVNLRYIIKKNSKVQNWIWYSVFRMRNRRVKNLYVCTHIIYKEKHEGQIN